MVTGIGVAVALPPELTATRAVTLWRWDPVAIVLVLIAAGLYGWGMWRVWRRHPRRPWPALRAASFYAGLAVVTVALCSSVGVYQDTLFWVHMVQHLMLIMVAPALLVVGRPLILLLHASRNPVHTAVKRILRSRPVTVLTCPLVGVPVYAAAVVATHLTGFMNVVITNPWAQTGEHALYLIAGWLYLAPGFGREPIRWRLSPPAKILLVVLAMPIDTFTGVVLLMTRHEPWSAYLDQHRSWGPTPLTDVHWGGAVMWIGADAVMMVLIVAALFSWLAAPRRERGLRWVEQARLTALEQRTGTATTGHTDVDEDEQRLAAYNDWLASMARHDDRRR
ncbi:membrane protein [Actinocatenispora thailandica]|uniref:Membrane protein n=1 Tax=Actinocatenispora thailandica TaxID=227318 RepID=A0A7R7HVY9_9ACTN|nr:cytochrome c oxidase assembly protein [Actinocatenispora thailandica]BCJ34161.1 membrane protein [Actinocatenispora thailandica]